MSKNWVKDIRKMHKKFGVKEKTIELDKELLISYMKFRFRFLQEELNEGFKAVHDRNPEEIVDALIDLCVVAIGTLDAYDVDAQRAWDEVLSANMKKKVGIKESRPNPYGLPDLVKPKDWTPPSHEGNHGIITKIV